MVTIFSITLLKSPFSLSPSGKNKQTNILRTELPSSLHISRTTPRKILPFFCVKHSFEQQTQSSSTTMFKTVIFVAFLAGLCLANPDFEWSDCGKYCFSFGNLFLLLYSCY